MESVHGHVAPLGVAHFSSTTAAYLRVCGEIAMGLSGSSCSIFPDRSRSRTRYPAPGKKNRTSRLRHSRQVSQKARRARAYALPPQKKRITPNSKANSNQFIAGLGFSDLLTQW